MTYNVLSGTLSLYTTLLRYIQHYSPSCNCHSMLFHICASITKQWELLLAKVLWSWWKLESSDKLPPHFVTLPDPYFFSGVFATFCNT